MVCSSTSGLDTGPCGAGPTTGALITYTFHSNHTETPPTPMAFLKREEFIAGRGYLEKAKSNSESELWGPPVPKTSK